MMVVISFMSEFLDPLLRGDKQQTTRKQTDRIKVGDTVHIYNHQRMRITDKEVRTPTEAGIKIIFKMIDEGRYPKPDDLDAGGWTVNPYYAHFLGKVKITEVYDSHPSKMSGEELEAWAWADGFDGLDRMDPFGNVHKTYADEWFTKRYGDGWMQQTWTVIRWNGWAERYFDPGEP